METRPLRCRLGKIRFWTITARGELRCLLDPDLQARYRNQGTRGKSYRQVQLLTGHRIMWFYVHRLMAYSWHGDPPHFLRTIVDHINGNSLCNDVENLRWVTRTANNINKRCYGLVETGGRFHPRIAGFTHWRYGSDTEDGAQEIRRMLVECYVRFTMRFPESGNDFPHYSIYKY